MYEFVTIFFHLFLVKWKKIILTAEKNVVRQGEILPKRRGLSLCFVFNVLIISFKDVDKPVLIYFETIFLSIGNKIGPIAPCLIPVRYFVYFSPL